MDASKSGNMKNLSFLQTKFKRPTSIGKVELIERKRSDGRGQVTVLYRFYAELIYMYGEFKALRMLSESAFKPKVNFKMNLRGTYEQLKKNRNVVKIEYSKMQFTAD